jgi:uncharacterized protein
MTTHPNVHIAVMARQPQPGRAKTRLIPALGADGAARLAQRLLEHALMQATRAAPGHVTLCLTPDAPEPSLQALAQRHGAALAAQGDGDLGARMVRALAHGLARAPAAVVIGTDAPQLDTAVLHAAADALATHDSVFVPAHDGGFVLLGLTRCPPGLLDGLSWSHAHVLRDTLARLRENGFSPTLLAPLHDIDTPDDLQHLPSGWLASDD